MANEIILKETELTDIAQRAIALDASMSSINTKLQKLYSQLDADIVMIQNAGAHITYGLPEISKNIRKQSEDMTNISRIMNTAGEKAVATNRTIIGEVEGVKAMSLSMETGATGIGVGAAIGAITGNYFGVNVGTGSSMSTVVSGLCDEAKRRVQSVIDPFGRLLYEVGDALVVTNVEKVEKILNTNPTAKMYYDELIAKGYDFETLYNMAAEEPENTLNILATEYDKAHKQEMQDRYDQLVAARKGVDFSNKSCAAYTYQQLAAKGIVANGDGISEGRLYYSVWTKRGVTKTGYMVESYGGSFGLDSLIAAHNGNAISNVAVSFNQDGKNYPHSEGHVLLIDKIIDGKVYYSENAGNRLYNLSGRRYAAGEPLCLTVEEFKKQYPGMNGVVHFYK